MKKLTTLLCFALSLLSTISCGLMDMEEEIAVMAVDMHLDRDTIYVMKGESFTVNPVFEPDSVSLDDIFWSTSDASIVSITDNTFTAVSEGWAAISGISVSRQISDTCHVCVFPSREFEVPVYPYETVFYANVTVHGKPFDPNTMDLVAYIGDEVHGVGIYREHNGIAYIELRVGMENFDEDDPADEYIKIMIYEKTKLAGQLAKMVRFDGGTHGTLGNLYKIEVK